MSISGSYTKLACYTDSADKHQVNLFDARTPKSLPWTRKWSDQGTCLLASWFVNPLTGACTYKRPEGGVCSKNHKKCPERAMLYLSEPVDRERVAEPRGIFFEAKKCRLLSHTRR